MPGVAAIALVAMVVLVVKRKKKIRSIVLPVPDGRKGSLPSRRSPIGASNCDLDEEIELK